MLLLLQYDNLKIAIRVRFVEKVILLVRQTSAVRKKKTGFCVYDLFLVFSEGSVFLVILVVYLEILLFSSKSAYFMACQPGCHQKAINY